ncbi:uncharacterized protein LOC126737731 [Anthonomus grandis grandis]|uniref:uncharacterized protein LOC126737731 n=1 Tax=Anthonomus grandis grandis TaxID=2921223 RepID=UPI002165C0FE|nr:uncharacterized protein LOC126737731 [Anthonomus grandis grandis]XP_050298701.1 uncharacterized protein LOC126737731 [Anthonomus grandis grandis]XP_050298702.1 uncharacterized protein LOC126737731 [Anthonomus grandis grandis]
MDLHFILTLLLLLRSSLAYEDSLSDLSDLYGSLNPDDDLQDLESLFERQTRTTNADKFLRFGRAFWDYDYGSDSPIVPNAEDKDAIRRSSSRTGSMTNTLQQRIPRDKSSFMRFGRSFSEEGNKKKRDKRESQVPDTFKRQENFLRFGRGGSSNGGNFMRFGRNYNLSMRNKQHIVEYLRSLLREDPAIRHGSDNNM